MSRAALVTGVTGQDGSYLSDYLLDNDYNVIGLHRRSSTNSFMRIQHLLEHPNFKLEEFDITDPSDCSRILEKYTPDEFYNLAAQSHVGTSFKQPFTTFEINTTGVINLLEALKARSPKTRFYQASTSEMFGENYTIGNDGKYQNEDTPFAPQSPYAVAKLASHRMVQIYRESYGLYACCGILFNHESPRRGENFVTRKITKYIGQLLNGFLRDSHYRPLKLGNIYAYRDWGHAKDFVRAMHMMLQQDSPEDFVVATGSTHTVKEFLEISFGLFNLNYEDYLEIDPSLYRPAEVDYLKGDSTRARDILGWEPEISFKDLVSDMVYSDFESANQIARHLNASFGGPPPGLANV
jgi:GDPmannose 4,6-dehydratase